jgi:hypothetical protein
MGAQRHFEREFVGADADLRLEPLTIRRDQIDDRDRRFEISAASRTISSNSTSRAVSNIA